MHTLHISYVHCIPILRSICYKWKLFLTFQYIDYHTVICCLSTHTLYKDSNRRQFLTLIALLNQCCTSVEFYVSQGQSLYLNESKCLFSYLPVRYSCQMVYLTYIHISSDKGHNSWQLVLYIQKLMDEVCQGYFPYNVTYLCHINHVYVGTYTNIQHRIVSLSLKINKC